MNGRAQVVNVHTDVPTVDIVPETSKVESRVVVRGCRYLAGYVPLLGDLVQWETMGSNIVVVCRVEITDEPRDEILADLSEMCGRPIGSFSDLTSMEVEAYIRGDRQLILKLKAALNQHRVIPEPPHPRIRQ